MPGKAAARGSPWKRSPAGPRLPSLLGSYRRVAVRSLGAEQYRGAEDMPVGRLHENREALAGSGRIERECRFGSAPLPERRQAFDTICIVERAARILTGTDLRPTLLRKADEPNLAVTGSGRSGADRYRAAVGGEGDRRDRGRRRLAQCRQHRLALRADHLARSVDDQLRRVGGCAEEARIAALTLGRLRCRERVLPAELVPVIDVEAERDDISRAAPARRAAHRPAGRRNSPA